jgi:hypothetical protein
MSVESSPEQHEIPVNMTNALNERFKGTILEELFAKYPNWVSDCGKFREEAFKILDNLALKNNITKHYCGVYGNEFVYCGVTSPIIGEQADGRTVAYLQIMQIWKTLKAIEEQIETNKNHNSNEQYIQAFKDQQVREIIAQNNRDALPQQIARFERQIQNSMNFGITVNKQFGRRLF